MKIGIAVKPTMIFQDNSSPKMTSVSLGEVKVEFRPLSIKHESSVLSYDTDDKYLSYFGPLPVDDLPHFRQKGPLCYVEDAPFNTKIEMNPSSPKVGMPFEIYYTIQNKTELQQKIKLSIVESEGLSSGLLLSGHINTDFILDRFEKKVIQYSFISTQVGVVPLPIFNVSSLRSNTWIFRGSGRSSVFVFP